MPIDQDSFLFGFGVGFMVSLYLGWILGRIKVNQGASRKPGQKASVTVKSEKSPSEIVRDAAAASMRTVFWVVLFVISLFVIGYALWTFMA